MIMSLRAAFAISIALIHILPAYSMEMECFKSDEKLLNLFANDASSEFEPAVFKIGETTWTVDARKVTKLSKKCAEIYRNEKSIVWNVSAREETFDEFIQFFKSATVPIRLDNVIELYELALEFQLDVDLIHCIAGFILTSFPKLDVLSIHDIARRYNDSFMLMNTSEYLSSNISPNKYKVPFKVFSFKPARNDMIQKSVDDRSYIKFSINTPGFLVGVEFAAFTDENLPYDLEYRFQMSLEEKNFLNLYEFTVKHYHKDANGMIYVPFEEAIYVSADYVYSVFLNCDDHNFGFSTGEEQTLFQINEVINVDGCQFTCIATDSQNGFLTKFSRVFFYPVLFDDVEIAQRDEL